MNKEIAPWVKKAQHAYRAGHRHLLKKTFILPDGTQTEFDVMNSGRVVCILALTKNNQVILAKQFRAGPEQVLLELPGGGIEPGETPQEAAARELLEETGYRGTLHATGESFHSAYDTLIRHHYIATDCMRIQNIQNDAHEFTEVVEMSLEEFRMHLRKGQLTDIGTGYLGLDALKLL